MSNVTSEDVQTWVMSKADEAELRLLQEVITLKLRLQFKVGDRVYFDAKTRGMVYGVITKLNAKSTKVRTDAGVTWTVSPQLLQRAPAVKATP